MGRCVCGVSFKVGLAKAATAGNLMPPNNHDFLVWLALLDTEHSTPLFRSHGHLFCFNAYHLLEVDFTDGHLTSIEARTSPIYYWKIFKKRQFLSQAFFWLKSLFLCLGILAWDLTNLKAIRTLLSEQIAPLNHFSLEQLKPLLNPFRRHTPYVTISMPYCDV